MRMYARPDLPIEVRSRLTRSNDRVLFLFWRQLILQRHIIFKERCDWPRARFSPLGLIGRPENDVRFIIIPRLLSPATGALVPTSAVTFIETAHGRLRRQQRGIDKKDLQLARKYGTRRPTYPRKNGDPTSVYTYRGITYVVNDVTGDEVTSWAEPIPLEPVPMKVQRTAEERAAHELQMKYGEDTSWWLSNTVFVVDTSRSMAKGDVWGCRTRLKAALFAMVLDFVAHRIEGGSAGSRDIVSMVTLCERPQLIIRERQCTWSPYNEIVEMYAGTLIEPRGHGPYLPCLTTVKQLFDRSADAGCALAIAFLSDGVPSDFCSHQISGWVLLEEIASGVGELARNCGRRLTFSAIGIGGESSFPALENMVKAAKDFGAHGIFQLPSMTAEGVGSAFTSVSTLLTSTQTEMTDVDVTTIQGPQNSSRISQKGGNQSSSGEARRLLHLWSDQSVKVGIRRRLIT
jgi:hypothetical protein